MDVCVVAGMVVVCPWAVVARRGIRMADVLREAKLAEGGVLGHGAKPDLAREEIR